MKYTKNQLIQSDISIKPFKNRLHLQSSEENCKMAEFKELNDLDFLAADFELIDNTSGGDLDIFAIMSENTLRTLLEEANNTVSEKTEDQRNAPT